MSLKLSEHTVYQFENLFSKDFKLPKTKLSIDNYQKSIVYV